VKRLALTSAVACGALFALWMTLKDGPQPKGSACVAIEALCDADPSDGGPRTEYRLVTVAADPLPDAGHLARRALDLLQEQTGCIVSSAYEDTTGALCAAQPNAVKVHKRAVAPFGCYCGVAKKRRSTAQAWSAVPWAYHTSLHAAEAGTLWRPDGGAAAMKRHPCTVLSGRHSLRAEGLCDEG